MDIEFKIEYRDEINMDNVRLIVMITKHDNKWVVCRILETGAFIFPFCRIGEDFPAKNMDSYNNIVSKVLNKDMKAKEFKLEFLSYFNLKHVNEYRDNQANAFSGILYYAKIESLYEDLPMNIFQLDTVPRNMKSPELAHGFYRYLVESKIPPTIKSIINNLDSFPVTIGCSSSIIREYENGMVLKGSPCTEEIIHEVEMMKWLKGKILAPEVITTESNDIVFYMLMTKVPGEMCCSDNNIANPEQTIKILANTIKKLWEIDITDCPYTETVDHFLQVGRYNIDNNIFEYANCKKDTFSPDGFKDVEYLYRFLEENKFEDDLVFSHSDFCLPNVFILNNKFSGIIDLGRSSVADRWRDISLCLGSIHFNFKTNEYDNLFFEELGIEPDASKIRYWQLFEELF